MPWGRKHTEAVSDAVGGVLGRAGTVKVYTVPSNLCGDACGKCHQASACTMQAGHNTSWHGHTSNASVTILADGVKGCGHSWGGEHH